MVKVIHLTKETELMWLGAEESEGPLPALFYFALSASESLELDPFNQPALFLEKQRLRIFSMNLPFHGPNLNPVHALSVWAEKMSQGADPLNDFITRANFAIDTLIEKGLIVREKIGIMGLSRGGLLGAHVAAKRGDIAALLAFAPLTHLSFAKEFGEIKELPSVQSFDLPNLTSSLCTKRIRFYIGNRDTRVSTRLCFEVVEKLTDAAFESGKRSPPIELIIRPSIGHMGHGTPRETFHDGASWISKTLGASR